MPALRVYFIQGLSPTRKPCMVPLNPFITMFRRAYHTMLTTWRDVQLRTRISTF